MTELETAAAFAVYTGLAWGFGCLATWLAVGARRREVDRELALHRRRLDALAASNGATFEALEAHVERFQAYVDADMKLDRSNAKIQACQDEMLNAQGRMLEILSTTLNAERTQDADTEKPA